MKSTFESEKTKKLEKTSLNVKFFDWDYLHHTALMKETYFKTVRTFTIIKKSSGRCDLKASGNREAPPNFQGAFVGYPQEFADDVPCPSDPCRTW